MYFYPMKNAFTLLFLVLISVTHSRAQLVSEAFVDSIVQQSMDALPQAGIAVAVIQEGKLTIAKGYGLASKNNGDLVDENTLFAIASNSKAFTSTALGMLVDEGKLTWDTKVVSIIPEFKMPDAYVTKEFTIVDLLTHRSGLGLGAGDLMLVPDGAEFDINDVLASFQHQEVVSSFRTQYDYDNLMYLIAGEVIYRISGLKWDKFVEQRIMKPLKMDRSAGLYQTLTVNTNIASPHKVEDGALIEFGPYEKNNGGFGAAGGIYSSVSDLSKWVMMHLNEGLYGEELEERLISQKNHDALWTAQTNMFFDATPPPPYRTHYKAYGLGFQLFDQNNLTIVQHSGGLPGMLSMVTMIPEKKAAVIVLTNCAPGGYSFLSVTREISDALIEVEGPDWVGIMSAYLERSSGHADSVVQAVWDQVEHCKNKKIPKDDYVGTYEDPWFGQIEISLVKDELWFTAKRSPKLHGQMFFYNANTFAIKWDYRDMECDAFASFMLDEEGKAQSIKMKGISPDIDFSYDFQDLNLKRVE
jgi:CubicO group peptidase (beta-lactamase class C family)